MFLLLIDGFFIIAELYEDRSHAIEDAVRIARHHCKMSNSPLPDDFTKALDESSYYMLMPSTTFEIIVRIYERSVCKTPKTRE